MHPADRPSLAARSSFLAALAASLVSFACASDAGHAGPGLEADGGLGPESEVGVASAALLGTVSLDAANTATCSLHTGGNVMCWGRFPHTGTNAPTPVRVLGLNGATSLSVGGNDACAVVAGRLWCWVLGGTPALTTSLTGVTQIAMGPASLADTHSCARTGGQIHCWGKNESGQLGDGTFTDRAAPTLIPGLADAAEVVVGARHSCARRTGGAVVCWGAAGFVGDGTSLKRSSPTAVTLGANAVALAAGDSHTCAVLTGGAVKCWGSNAFFKLGDGTTSHRLAPVTVTGVTDAAGVAVGRNHTCIRRTGGGVVCFGDNSRGQAGTMSPGSPVRAPFAVPSITGASTLSSGMSHTCATITSPVAETRCWGDNAFRQLGDGSAVPYTQSAPSIVLGDEFKTNGSTCSSDGQCQSGFCTDGRCCNARCGTSTTDCQACSTAAGAAQNGTCGPRGSGAACGSAAGPCEIPAVCGGTALTCPAKVPRPSGTPCGSEGPFCPLFCDAAGVCVDGVGPACLP